MGKVSNSRKGYSMTISELEMGRKGKGKESFQSLPKKGDFKIFFDQFLGFTLKRVPKIDGSHIL